MAKDSGANRRAHLRYRDPDTQVVNLSFVDESGESRTIKALVANESFTGMACVYVGEAPFLKGDEIKWLETPNIQTPLLVVRCFPIEEDVYYLALKII